MILKIIGIILLVLVLLALALVLLVLCTPLRYRLQGSYRNGKPDVEAKIHIWFSVLAAYVRFTQDGLSVYLRIFGIRKYLVRPQKQEEGTSTVSVPQKDDPLKNEIIKEKTQYTSEKEDVSSTNDESEAEYHVQLEETPKTEPPREAAEKNTNDVISEASDEGGTEKVTSEKEKKSLSEQLQGVLEKCSGLAGKVKALYEKAQKLYSALMKKKQAVEWFLGQASTKHMLLVLKKQGIKIFKSILPRKLAGELTLGLDDPATMGQICMFGGVLYPMYEKRFKFTPVFDEQVIDGEGYFKGRIILGTILAHVLRILLVPDFYRCVKNVKILMKKIK